MANRIVRESIGSKRAVVGSLSEGRLSVVGEQRVISYSGVADSRGIGKKRSVTNGCIGGAFGVAKESERPISEVSHAYGVTQKRPRPSGRVFICSVTQERPGADPRAEVAVGEA